MGNYELGENICKQCDSRGYNFQNKKSSSCNSITKTPNKKKEQKPIQTILHRRYTAGQEAHEKMLNITHFLRNANQNYNEVSPHANQNGHHQMMERVWRKGNSPTLLVGMEIGAATMEKQYGGS